MSNCCVGYATQFEYRSGFPQKRNCPIEFVYSEFASIRKRSGGFIVEKDRAVDLVPCSDPGLECLIYNATVDHCERMTEIWIGPADSFRTGRQDHYAVVRPSVPD